MTKTPEIRRAVVADQYAPEKRVLIKALAGLHYIKGNSAPYFTLTGEVLRQTRVDSDGKAWFGDVDSCGAIHETLVAQWPELATLAALHLSDMDGRPMHAAGNGLYWLAGAMASPHAPNLPVWGERYHGASGSGGRTPAECLTIAASHFRAPEAELMAMAESMRYATGAAVREAVAAYCAAQAAQAAGPVA